MRSPTGVLAGVALAAGTLGGLIVCAGEQEATPDPGSSRSTSPRPSADTVRVVVASAADSTTVYADGPARLLDLGAESGSRVVGRAPRYRAWTLRDREGDVSVSGPGVERPRRFDSLAVAPVDSAASVFLDGRPYRGRAAVYPVEGHGLVLANDVPLEPYVATVVSAEMGPAGREVKAAVKALAVAARTFTVRFRGRRDSLRADLLATAADQVYRGRLAERPRVTRWTLATAGELLLHEEAPIRAYYHAACGGRTARPADLWERAGADYLQSVSDTAPDGSDYCRIAPLHRWERRWSSGDVAEALVQRQELGASPATLVALSVAGRSRAGRVTALEAVLRIDASTDTLVVVKDALLDLLPRDEPGLPSTWFELVRSPPEADSVVVRGRGSGHGVGLCQWGTISRARAGQGYREILRAYYPGAEVGGAPRADTPER